MGWNARRVTGARCEASVWRGGGLGMKGAEEEGRAGEASSARRAALRASRSMICTMSASSTAWTDLFLEAYDACPLFLEEAYGPGSGVAGVKVGDRSVVEEGGVGGVHPRSVQVREHRAVAGGVAGGVSVERGGRGRGRGGTYSSSFWRSERAGIVLVEEKNASRVL